MSWLLLVLTLFLLLQAHAQQGQIIDFTYTQLLQSVAASPLHSERISIFPDPHTPSYSFPHVCTLHALLQQDTHPATAAATAADSEDHLTLLRARVLQLLRLAEQIRKAKADLQQIHAHLELDQTNTGLLAFQSGLSRLTSREQSLASRRESIEQLTAKLNDLVHLYNDSPRSHQFREAALQFELHSLAAKLTYLTKLRDRTAEELAARKPVNYSAFFAELEGDMGRQGELILEIDQILGNFSDVSYLRSKLAGLQSKAEALDLYIEEKQNCISERERAKKKGSNEEIRDTMERLRQKKKEFGSQVNKYCEGVAKKLQSQIKKLLKVYNLTYACAEGLDQLTAERTRHQQDLAATRARLRLIEEQGFEQYHRSYNSTRDSIRTRLEQMRHFSVDEYRHDPNQLDALIREANDAKIQVEKQLAAVPQGSTGPALAELKTLVEDIKKQKAAYCVEYEQYDRDSRTLWGQVAAAEQKQKFASRMRAVYLEEAGKLQQLEAVFRNSSQQITALLAH